MPVLSPKAIRVRTAGGWQDIALVGPAGPAGAAGAAGATGATGPAGATGPGVPVGGTGGQVLAKSSGVDYATDWITPLAAPAYVTSLPGSPVDGQEVYYQSAAMATTGVIWHLRYRAAIADAYKWEYLGGGPLQHEIMTGQNAGTANTWVNLASDGPLVTCPLAGIYSVNFGARMSCGNRGITMQVGAAIGDTAPAVPVVQMAAPDTGVPYTVSIVTSGVSRTRLTVAAGNIIKHRYWSGLATGATVFFDRVLDATPMRVG